MKPGYGFTVLALALIILITNLLRMTSGQMDIFHVVILIAAFALVLIAACCVNCHRIVHYEEALKEILRRIKLYEDTQASSYHSPVVLEVMRQQIEQIHKLNNQEEIERLLGEVIAEAKLTRIIGPDEEDSLGMVMRLINRD